MSCSVSSASSRSSRYADDRRVGEVEHLLVPGRHRLPARHREDPVGVGPEQVRVGVDHLRLDPEAELHPPVPDVADQRAEPVRPDRLVDVPVAEPGGVVPAVPEPAVVEHEPLHPGLGGEVGQLAPAGPRSWSKYTASQTLSVAGRGLRGCSGRDRSQPWKAAEIPSSPAPLYAAHSSGVAYSCPGARTTSPGSSSSPPPSRATPRGARSA